VQNITETKANSASRSEDCARKEPASANTTYLIAPHFNREAFFRELKEKYDNLQKQKG